MKKSFFTLFCSLWATVLFTASLSALPTPSPVAPNANSGIPLNAAGKIDATALPNSAVLNYAVEDTDAITQRIAGKTASAGTLAIFSAANDTTHTYTRNPALWCADLDLSCISASTSVGWRITMVTPRHGLTAHHIGMTAGTVGYWVDGGSATYSRTVTAVTNVVGDLDLVTLDSDLPASITPASILPPSIPAGFQTGTGSLIGCPVITHDQTRKLCLAKLGSLYANAGSYLVDSLALPTAGSYAPWNRAASTAGSGSPFVTNDSSSPYFLIIRGRPVLLGCASTTVGSYADPGANATALQAAIGSGYALSVAAMPPYPAVPGASATVSVGSVSSGSTVGVTNSGTNTAAILNFVLPQGQAGAAGSPGAPGTPGAQGPAGPATLALGTVTTLPAGSQATATLTNNGSGAYTLSFAIPQGSGTVPAGLALDPGANGALRSGGYVRTLGHIETGLSGFISTADGEQSNFGGHIDTSAFTLAIDQGYQDQDGNELYAYQGYNGGQISTTGGGEIYTGDGGGSINTSGSLYNGFYGGHIDTSISGGAIITTNAGGSINTSLNGGSIDTTTNGGTIYTGTNGGSINTSNNGGTINTTDTGGAISTANGGGYISTANGGGYIATGTGGYIATGTGGYIATGTGGYIDTTNGGHIDTTNGGGTIYTGDGGGAIYTGGGGGAIYTSNNGGTINTSGGGGGINTSGGGGFITTNGTGNPNGQIFGGVGSIYTDKTNPNTSGHVLWIKESGSGNTGWVGK